MNMNDLPAAAPAAATPSVDVHQQLGEMARVLHDSLSQLGVMPRLGELTESIPDARSRLTYIAKKTEEAAEKVLNLVDQAKGDHAHIAEQTRIMAAAIVSDPVKAVASGAVMNFVGDV